MYSYFERLIWDAGACMGASSSDAYRTGSVEDENEDFFVVLHVQPALLQSLFCQLPDCDEHVLGCLQLSQEDVFIISRSLLWLRGLDLRHADVSFRYF